MILTYATAALALWAIERTARTPTPAEPHDEKRCSPSSPVRCNVVCAGGADHATCTATDHALVALVCALVARAAALGKVHPVPDEHHEAARTEGWIALPLPDALSSL
ncbi:MAG: DUF429 domain-containing protein [Deltaproteobacteria bacterium]|nr:DUF429 domain-containing protein [Deltaproteobacteria bacterium]